MSTLSGLQELTQSPIMLFAIYLLQAFGFYRLAQKAGVKNEWIAFIPILQFILFFHIIDRSAWHILIVLLFAIPVIGWLAAPMIFAYFQYEFYQRFGVEPLLGVVVILVGVFVPIVSSVFFLFIAFSELLYQGVNRYGN
ncbi:hypothetical protein SANA_09090 [Gottschalkiaceae bacterium SANA]|nr:hypothetical protein SANA_09090 [Gottschalkiaceae bacterium SANA]